MYPETYIFRKLGLALGLASMALMTASSHAALFYLEVGEGGTSWNTSANWNSASDGSGTNPGTMAGNDFDNNGFVLGTNSGDTIFPGNSLTLSGGTLNLRNGGTKTVAALFSTGNALISNNQVNTVLAATTYNLSGAATFQVNAGGSTAYLSTYNIGTLSGAGNILLDTTGSGTNASSKTFLLNVTNGLSYTGNITWSDAESPSLQFGSDTVFGGGLVALSTSRITLDRDVTFSSVTLGATSLAAGYYDYAYLNTNFADIFNEGGSGSITVVPEPSSWALGSMTLGLFLAGARRRRGRNAQATR